MKDMPLYKSKRRFKNLWQQYRIYEDRVELQSWVLLHTLKVPTSDIAVIEVCSPVFRGSKQSAWALKIDHCDFHRHVLLTRRRGVFKQIGFTPDEPKEFVEVCQSVLLALSHPSAMPLISWRNDAPNGGMATDAKSKVIRNV